MICPTQWGVCLLSGELLNPHGTMHPARLLSSGCPPGPRRQTSLSFKLEDMINVEHHLVLMIKIECIKIDI